MDKPADYGHALHHLARAQTAILMSSGDKLAERLAEFVEQTLKDVPPDYLMAALEEHRLIARHTHDSAPTRAGMYLKLLHGRGSIREEMNDWGPDGPWIGPLKWFHCTYLSSAGIGFEDGGELAPLVSGGELPSPMFFTSGLLYFNGTYYGDWELQQISV